MDASDYKPWAAAGWRGRIHRQWPWDERGDPLPALLREPAQRQLRDKCAVRVWRVETGGRVVYLKHIRGPKNRPPAQINVIERAKWRLGGSRALAVLRTHRRMERAGLRVAPVLLAARRWRAGWPEELLITGGVEALALSGMLRTSDAMARRDALARAGTALAALHRAGFAHGDPTTGNLLMPADEPPCWLDNDRTRRWRLVPRARRLRNLATLAGRALVQCPWREVLALLEAYRQAMGVPETRWRRDRLRVLRRIRHQERRGGRKRMRLDGG